MDLLTPGIEFFSKLFSPDGLQEIMTTWGWLAYLLLFCIVFAESGLFFGFCLPGDSLLFVAGFVCSASNSALRFEILAPLLIVGAITGDSVGYWFGNKMGPLLFSREDSLFFKRAHLMKAHNFYEKHGKKTIVLARFVPIVRTFAPIVAGAARMEYKTFLAYNIGGGIFWVISLMGLGYILGDIPVVKENLEKAVLLVIFISILPIIIEGYKGWREKKSEAQ